MTLDDLEINNALWYANHVVLCLNGKL